MLRRKGSVLGLSLLLAILTLLLARPSSVSVVAATDRGNEAGWRIECIDCGPTFAAPSIGAAVSDGQGLIHIFYGGEALYHSWTEGDEWQSEILFDKLGAGEYAQAAISEYGELHVVFTYGDQLLYGHLVPGQPWGISPVSGYDWPLVERYELELDAAGRPMLVYYSAAGSLLRLAALNNGVWQHEMIVQAPLEQFALTVDSQKRPVVAYFDTSERLFWGYLEGSWQWEQVPATPPDSYYVTLDIALDSHDRPAIAIDDYVHIKTPLGWQEEVPLQNGSPSQGIDLMFDSADVLWLAQSLYDGSPPYPFGISSYIHLLKQGSEGWERININGGIDGLAGTIVYAAQHEIALLYAAGRFDTNDLDRSSMRLLLAAEDVPVGTWSSKVIVTGVDSGQSAALELQSWSRASVLSWNPHRYAFRLTTGAYGEWQTMETEMGLVYFGSKLAFAVGRDGVAHQIYSKYCRACSDVRYRFGSGESWQIIYLDISAAGFDIAVGSDGQARVSLSGQSSDYSERGIFYGVMDLNAPQVFTYEVIMDSDLPAHTALALAADDTPHVVWDSGAQPGSSKLIYAVKANDTWEWAVLSEAAVDPGIALDSQERPHIIYFHGTELMYTFPSGAAWQYERITDLTVPGTKASIAVSLDGVVHVAYHDPVAQALKYAWRQHGSWQIVTVDDRDDTGWYADIAVDELGFPHIVYQNADRRDLLYATLSPAPQWFYLPVVR